MVFSIAFHYSWPPGPVAGRTPGANINSYSCKLGARHPRNPQNICSGERERQTAASRQLVVQSELSLLLFFFSFPRWKKSSPRNHCSLDGKAIRGNVGRGKKMLPQKQQESRIHVVARRACFFLFSYLFIYFWQPKSKDWRLDAENSGSAVAPEKAAIQTAS